MNTTMPHPMYCHCDFCEAEAEADSFAACQEMKAAAETITRARLAQKTYPDYAREEYARERRMRGLDEGRSI